MADQDLQRQIDAINQKLDFILEEITAQKQSRESIEDLTHDLSLIAKDSFKSTVLELDKSGVEVDGNALSVLLVKFMANLGNINELLDTFESARDFMKDAEPILHQIGLDAVNKMAEFERKGYFDLIKALGQVGDNVLAHYTLADIHDLADNVVNILDTIKRITQPDMLNAVNNAIMVYNSMGADKVEEYSLWRVMREMRTPEMRKGLGFMISFMKNLAKQNEQNKKLLTIK